MGLKMKQVAALLQGSPRNWLAPPRGCHCSHSPPCLSCIPFHTAALAPSGCALGCQGRWSGWLKLVLSQAVLTFHRLSLQISPGFEVEQAAFPSFSIPNVHWSRVFTCKPYKCATAHSFTSLHFKRFPCILEEILPLGLSEKRWFFFFFIMLQFWSCMYVQQPSLVVACLSLVKKSMPCSVHVHNVRFQRLNAQTNKTSFHWNKGTSHIHARSWVSYLQLFPP